MDRWNERRKDGHAVGNIEIIEEVEKRGSYEQAVDALCEQYGVSTGVPAHQVLPVTVDSAELVARLENSEEIHGECNIDVPQHDASLHIQDVWLEPDAQVTERVKQALLEADLVVLSMGDLYTSVIANLLVQGVSEAISQSNAVVSYVCNRSTKQGETHDFSTMEYYTELSRYLAPATVQYMIVDTGEVAVPSTHQAVRFEALPAEVEVMRAELSHSDMLHFASGEKAAAVINTLCTSL